MKKALFFLSTTLGALSYETERNVLKLSQADFDQALQEYPDMLVKFYAPWCGHCKTLAPTYLDAADQLQELGSTVKLAEVDCTVHKPLCQKYEVKGYPTVHFFSKGNTTPTKYSSARTKQAIVDWVNEKVPLEEKTEETKEEQIKEQQKQQQAVQFERDGKVLKLNGDTFSLAKQKFDYLFVKFFAPWCGHCKNMAAAWTQLADSITDSNVAIAEVDCTQHQPVCSQNEVKGYPTLKLFIRGNEPIAYRQARNFQAFTSFIEQQKSKLMPGAVVEEKPEQL